MNLNDTLEYIAADFGLDADELKRYASEDKITGWDNGKGAYPIGSLFAVEGQTLYALIRATKPQRVLELGTRFGCSATHIAAALVKNESGSLVCVDSDTEAGSMIPARFRDYIEFVYGDIYDYVRTVKGKFDFVYEDASHQSELVASVWAQRMKLLNPGGWMISHDAAHYLVGAQVMRGIRSCDVEPKVYLTEPSDCGLAVYRIQPETDYTELSYADIKQLISERKIKTRAKTKNAMIEALIDNDSE